MKEYTVTYTAKITDIIPPEAGWKEEQIMALTPEIMANTLRAIILADNVVVSDLKVFNTGDNE